MRLFFNEIIIFLIMSLIEIKSQYLLSRIDKLYKLKCTLKLEGYIKNYLLSVTYRLEKLSGVIEQYINARKDNFRILTCQIHFR